MDGLNVLGSRKLRTMPLTAVLWWKLAHRSGRIPPSHGPQNPPLEGDICVGNLRIACASRGLAVTSSEIHA